MASFNPVTKKFTFAASDERLVQNARSLCNAIADYAETTEQKQAATTAYNALQHVLAYIQGKRK